MTEEIVKPIIDMMKKDFDSHDFIKEFIWQQPAMYGEMLMMYNNVTTVHSLIGRFLLDHASSLEIRKIGENESDDLFGHPTPCAQWYNINKE